MKKILILTLSLFVFGTCFSQTYEQKYQQQLQRAKAGDSQAQMYLGWAYETGSGTVMSYDSAFFWLSKAAERNQVNAQAALACYYANGWRTAADKGNAQGQCDLGIMYYNGTGVQQDYYKAFSLFQKAAAQNYTDAFYMLGLCYHYGLGTSVDLAKARGNYQKAAAQNHQRAAEQLRQLPNDNNQTNANLAKITLLSSENSQSTSYNLNAGVKSNSRIETYAVYVNGKIAPKSTRGINSVNNDGYDLMIDETINLNYGGNSIKISVTNGSGTATFEKTIYVN